MVFYTIFRRYIGSIAQLVDQRRRRGVRVRTGSITTKS